MCNPHVSSVKSRKAPCPFSEVCLLSGIPLLWACIYLYKAYVEFSFLSKNILQKKNVMSSCDKGK